MLLVVLLQLLVDLVVELAQQDMVLKETKDEIWKKTLTPSNKTVTLDQMGPITEKALQAFGIRDASVEVVHIDGPSEKSRTKLHQALVENERSSDDFIILNFLQGA